MLFFFKKNSRTVNQDDILVDDDDDQQDNEKKCTCLTVWRKSLVFSCKGFTVIGSDGNLVYRVDNYSGRPGRVILMDGSGNPILTMFRRKVRIPSLLDS